MERRHQPVQLITILAVRLSLLSYVRQLMIYSGKESPTFEAVDVSLVVRGMLQLLKVSISKRAVFEN